MLRSLSAILLLVLGATFTHEWSVQAPAELQRGPLSQSQAAVAGFDGGLLITWFDGRSGTSSLYATVATLDGGVADPAGLEIVGEGALSPSVACSQTQCLVAWLHVDAASAEVGQIVQAKARAARVGFDGVRIDAQPIELGPATDYYSWARPAVASDGTDFLVLFPHATGQLRVRGAVVSALGAATPVAAPALLAGSTEQWFPTMSWSGGAYLATWSETGAANVIRAVHLTQAGALVPDSGVSVPLDGGAAWHTTASCGGSSCLVAWSQTGGTVFAGVRLGLDGAPLDPQPLALANAPSYPAFAAAARGEGFVFVHHRVGGVGAVHVDADGGLAPIMFADDPASSTYPMLASSGDRLLLSLNERTQGYSDVALRWLGVDGGAFEPASQILPLLGSTQRLPALARVEGGHVMVWQDWRTDQNGLRAAFISPETGLVPPDGIPLPTGAISPTTIAAERCGDQVLVAWDTSTPAEQIQLLRLALDGTPIGAPEVLAQHSVGVQHAAIASSGDLCLVAWSQYDNRWDTRAARFDRDGGRLDTPSIAVATGGGHQYLPSVAWDGTAFVVTWANGTSNPITSISARRIDPDGGLASAPAPLVATSRSHARVACDGAVCLMLWLESASGSVALKVSRVDPAAGVSSPDGGVLLEILPPEVNTHAAQLVATPSGFQAVWETGLDGGIGLRLATLDPAGPTVLSLREVPVGTARLAAPAIAAGGPGQTLLAYTAVEPPPSDGTRQVRARYLLDCDALSASGVTCATACELDPAQCEATDGGDASPDPRGPLHLDVGCGCGASGAAVFAWLPLLLAGLVRAKRRRSRQLGKPVHAGRSKLGVGGG